LSRHALFSEPSSAAVISPLFSLFINKQFIVSIVDTRQGYRRPRTLDTLDFDCVAVSVLLQRLFFECSRRVADRERVAFSLAAERRFMNRVGDRIAK